MLPLRLLSAATVAFALCAAAPLAAAQTFSDGQRGEIETIVKNYLLAHPEILEDMSAELGRRQAAAEQERHAKAVKVHAETIFNSPRGVVLGNPQGDVTLVEFFDYNCPYCKRALPDMTAMLKGDSQLRIVLKEFPILSRGSLEAAQVGVAVNLLAPDRYLAFHERLLASEAEADKSSALAAAEAAGVDKAKLEKMLEDPRISEILQESFELADALGITGTPSYVIGNEVIPGAVGSDQLSEKIAAVRECGKTVC